MPVEPAHVDDGATHPTTLVDRKALDKRMPNAAGRCTDAGAGDPAPPLPWSHRTRWYAVFVRQSPIEFNVPVLLTTDGYIFPLERDVIKVGRPPTATSCCACRASAATIVSSVVAGVATRYTTGAVRTGSG